MTKFPSQKQLKEMRKKLEKGPAARPLPKAATSVDKVKYKICEQFVIYKNSQKMTQKALAEKLDLDEALMSKILHYNFDEFTVDRLLKFLNVLYPNVEIELRVAS
jgi:predicted XRE-type DNA-binding protein